MRLINTNTLVITEFYGSDIPRYAILSHTWGQEEITFQEWTAWQTDSDLTLSRKEGFIKIQGACRQACRDKLKWLWVDTNCIDKTSSSELSEAINSMYAWYRDAVICYAFLADVPPLRENDPDPFKHFRKSRWFTRGWTLQELLAPKRLDFFANTWSRFGSKSGSLIKVIHETTDIELSCLSGHMDVGSASVAKKMSWLSKRTTTRLEDIAYCMLGIFDINMPLLYGEGMKAFTRLQNEIVRHVYDHTIFCWTWDDHVPPGWVSMLAPSPQVFQNSGDYVQRENTQSLAHYSTTNLGLLLTLPAIYTLGSRLLVVLDAGLSKYAATKRVCIPLRRPSEQAVVFERVHFPASPLSIPLMCPYKMARCSLYALNKPTPSTLKSRPNRIPSRFGVLLIVEPTASRFIGAQDDSASGLPTNQALLIHHSIISTYPPRMFDDARDLAFVPLSSNSVARYTLTMEVSVWRRIDTGTSHTERYDQTYYLFLAIESSRDPRWHCYITTRRLLRRSVDFDSAFSDVQAVDRHFQDKFANIWESERFYNCYISEQLQVTIGKRLMVHPDVEVRSCFFSEKMKVSVDLRDSESEGSVGDDENDSICVQAHIG